MQKILHFELMTAMKDRPKAFQFITLALVSFSVTVILLSLMGVPDAEKSSQASRQNNTVSFSEVSPASTNSLLPLKK